MTSTLTDIKVKTISGTETQLSAYAGKVLLIVNVASYCGYTSQYKGLEALQQKYQAQGLRVLGFPCNDFGAQEPGSNAEIVQFCERNYGVTFDLFDKVHAKGANQHPLYAQLTQTANPPGDVSWNFEKFLVGKKGELLSRFGSGVSPESPQLVTAIEQALAA
jgi:glutathione peroxidase